MVEYETGTGLKNISFEDDKKEEEYQKYEEHVATGESRPSDNYINTKFPTDTSPERKKCTVCKQALPATDFHIDVPEIRSRIRTCGVCWRKHASDGIRDKRIRLHATRGFKGWFHITRQEIMLLLERGGVDITWVGMNRKYKKETLKPYLIQLANGQTPAAIGPPETEGLLFCHYGKNRGKQYGHWAPPEEFRPDPRRPGYVSKLCNTHRGATRRRYRKKAEQKIPGGTEGKDENEGKIMCSAATYGWRGHWCAKEDFGDPTRKFCADCRILWWRPSTKRWKRWTDYPPGTEITEGPYQGMVQCWKVHCVPVSEYGPKKPSGEYHAQCIKCLQYTLEYRKSTCYNCKYRYKDGETKEGHLRICPKRFCSVCRHSFWLNDLYKHMDGCYRKLLAEKKKQKAKGVCAYMPHLPYKGCSNKPKKGRETCEAHLNFFRNISNTDAEMKQLSATFLGDEGQKGVEMLIRTRPNLVELMDTMEDLLRNSPERVLFCDTEWFGNSQEDENDPTASYLSQISIRNGRLDVVVPEATIFYPMTKSELWDLSGCTDESAFMSRSTFSKFYGSADNDLATGHHGACSLGFGEIANMIEDYYAEQGLARDECVFIEWSSSGCTDYRNIMKGLRMVGKQDVLPQMPLIPEDRLNVMSFWRTLRDCVEQRCIKKKRPIPRMGTNLGNLYSIFYPEDLKTLYQAHTADADTRMLFAVTKLLFNIYSGRPEPGRIENYLESVEEEAVDNGPDPDFIEHAPKKADKYPTDNQPKPGRIDSYFKSTKADAASTKGKSAPLRTRVKARTKALDNAPKDGPMDRFLTKAEPADGSEIESAVGFVLGKSKRAAVNTGSASDEDRRNSSEEIRRPDKRWKLS